MISSEVAHMSQHLEPYGPPTLTESMTESMTLRAQEVAARYDRYDVSLLAESLGSVGMNLLDLSSLQMNELAEIEGSLERQYGINEQDDEYDEEQL